MVSPAGGEESHGVSLRPLGQASRKQTNNLISVMHKCVNTSAWKPICQRLTYDFEALTTAVERRCPVVVGFRSGSGHSTRVSFELWLLGRGSRLSGVQAPCPQGPRPPGAPCFRGRPPQQRLHPRTSFVSEPLAMLKEAPAPPGATFFFRKIVNTGKAAAHK